MNRTTYLCTCCGYAIPEASRLLKIEEAAKLTIARADDYGDSYITQTLREAMKASPSDGSARLGSTICSHGAPTGTDCEWCNVAANDTSSKHVAETQESRLVGCFIHAREWQSGCKTCQARYAQDVYTFCDNTRCSHSDSFRVGDACPACGAPSEMHYPNCQTQDACICEFAPGSCSYCPVHKTQTQNDYRSHHCHRGTRGIYCHDFHPSHERERCDNARDWALKGQAQQASDRKDYDAKG